MKVVFGGRQTGKTSGALYWLIQNPQGILVTHSHLEAERLRHHTLVENSNVDPKRIMSWHEYHSTHKTIGSKFKEVQIDNVDLILQQLFRERINTLIINDVK